MSTTMNCFSLFARIVHQGACYEPGLLLGSGHRQGTVSLETARRRESLIASSHTRTRPVENSSALVFPLSESRAESRGVRSIVHLEVRGRTCQLELISTPPR